ncbi:hypothetical protein HAX54_026613 [Datura stramonium]|uniref:Uncharacterized protein n=1 Tax=Datura stramonium TaxID=4076 RepID=A0ABS8S7Z6_DATST|nr:hypothetical protein [Datura stramonium]
MDASKVPSIPPGIASFSLPLEGKPADKGSFDLSGEHLFEENLSEGPRSSSKSKKGPNKGPITRGKAKRKMDEVLKENCDKTLRRHRMMRKTVVEEEGVELPTVDTTEGPGGDDQESKRGVVSSFPKNKGKTVTKEGPSNTLKYPPPDEHFEKNRKIFTTKGLGGATVVKRKQMFTLSTLEECEYVAKKGGVGVQSTFSGLIDAQQYATEEVDHLSMLLTQKKAEMALLKVEQDCKGTMQQWKNLVVYAIYNLRILN